MGRLSGQMNLQKGFWEDAGLSFSTNKHAVTISLMPGIPLNWVKSHQFALRNKLEN